MRPLLALVLASSVPGGAVAAEIVVVGLFDPDVDAAAQRAVLRSVTAAVEARGHDVLDASAVGPRLAGHELRVLDAAYRAAARAAVAEGVALRLAGDAAGAVARLEPAVADLTVAALAVPDVTPLAAAHAELAAARLAAGDETGARDSVDVALALGGGTVPPVEAPPAGLAAVIAEEARLARDETQRLVLPAIGRAEARVWLDGRPLGVLPVTVPGVLPGVHTLVVRTSDGRRQARLLDVRPGGLASPSLTPDAPRLPAPRDDARWGELSVALVGGVVAATDADLGLVAGWTDDGFVVQAVGVDGWSAATAVSADDPAALSAAVGAVLGAPRGAVAVRPPLDPSTNIDLARLLLLPEVAPPAPAPALAEAPRPTTQAPARAPVRWPVWLGVGLGVALAAGLGAGLGVGLSAAPLPTSGTVIVTPP